MRYSLKHEDYEIERQTLERKIFLDHSTQPSTSEFLYYPLKYLILVRNS